MASQEEVACLLLQLSVTRISRQVLFPHTAHPDVRHFLLNSYETLTANRPRFRWNTEPQHTEYQRRPKYFEDYCPADFASQLRKVYPGKITLLYPHDDKMDDDPVDSEMMTVKDMVIMKLSNGICIRGGTTRILGMSLSALNS